MPTFPAGVVASALVAFAVLVASPASSLTLTVSDVVSQQPANCGLPGEDPCILAEWLDGTLDIDVDTVDEQVTLILTNTSGSGGDPTFNINELYFSTSDVITSLSLVSSTHSIQGLVTSWKFHTSSGAGGQTQGDGFGVHDYAIKTKSNHKGTKVESGESITFVLDYTASAVPSMQSFAELSEQPGGSGNHTETLATVKFIQGSSASVDLGGNDSAFGGVLDENGGVVPEPGTAVLFGTGFAALSAFGRRRGAALR